jgi:hypothetical protein
MILAAVFTDVTDGPLQWIEFLSPVRRSPVRTLPGRQRPVTVIFGSARICEPQYIVIRTFIHQWHYSPYLGPGLFFSLVIFFTHTVGLLGRVISPSQGRYLHAEQHKRIINAHTDIHALSRILTHDPNVRESEECSCLRPRGHCDRLYNYIGIYLFSNNLSPKCTFSFSRQPPHPSA